MTTFSVKLVDHTGTPDKWLQGLRSQIQDLFDQCIAPTSVHRVVVTWGTGVKDDNLVLHFVEDVDHSYIQQKLPGALINEFVAGHTRTQKNVTGSEFYKLVGKKGERALFKYVGYAKAALHESMHNLFPAWSEADMHGPAGGGGIAASPPQLPPTDKNKELLLRGLSIKNEQLL
jgi:hypothetical protein